MIKSLLVVRNSKLPYSVHQEFANDRISFKTTFLVQSQDPLSFDEVFSGILLASCFFILDNATYNCSCEKTCSGRYKPTKSKVFPWA